mgnify:CR=1 FL=1
MKEELKDKDIIYLYITGENVSTGNLENMILTFTENISV